MAKGRVILVICCTLVAAVATITVRNYLGNPVASGALHVRAALSSDIPAMVRSLHPSYPYSVIPGGVYAPVELRSAMEADPVVRTHYADFDASRTRLVTLTEDAKMFVSYRKAGQVYWTKGKLKIPQGEVLITDGTSYARTRCGNRLSEKPGKLAVSEPLIHELSQPTLSGNLFNTPGVTFASLPVTQLQLPMPELPIAGMRFPPIAVTGPEQGGSGGSDEGWPAQAPPMMAMVSGGGTEGRGVGGLLRPPTKQPSTTPVVTITPGSPVTIPARPPVVTIAPGQPVVTVHPGPTNIPITAGSPTVTVHPGPPGVSITPEVPIEIVPVPEPGEVAVMGLVLVALIGFTKFANFRASENRPPQ